MTVNITSIPRGDENGLDKINANFSEIRNKFVMNSWTDAGITPLNGAKLGTGNDADGKPLYGYVLYSIAGQKFATICLRIGSLNNPNGPGKDVVQLPFKVHGYNISTGYDNKNVIVYNNKVYTDAKNDTYVYGTFMVIG
ncbi:hypothetical protein [Ligilactobacillus agilis]|uniref:hypothetical protein n=1 Tax=Ligilactobacillus agilis TaxID=1601 RepID=UPI002432072E|nr:hypothetical protein [Ligilactobacillus agilis]